MFDGCFIEDDRPLLTRKGRAIGPALLANEGILSGQANLQMDFAEHLFYEVG
jgi:hypothetical protein